MNEVEHLGHIIDRNGIRVNPNKTEAPITTNVKELQCFIGGVNYYAKFIPDMAKICKSLYKLLEKDIVWGWQNEQERASHILKSKLTSAPVLAVYDKKLRIKLDCDASKYGVGAVLSQVNANDEENPIAYASRTLNKSKANYSQLDKEALSIIFGLKKFNQYLFGRHFTLCCDNKALCSILGNKSNVSVLAASRLIRWSIFMSSYDYDIEFRPTTKHCNADMLSRLPSCKIPSTSKCETLPNIQLNHIILHTDTVVEETENEPELKSLYHIEIGHLPIDADIIRQQTQNDPELKMVLTSLEKDKRTKDNIAKLHMYYLKRHELSIEDGIVMWGLRVVVPQCLRDTILKELHQQHPGIVRMKSLSRMHVWYPNIDKDISELVSHCTD